MFKCNIFKKKLLGAEDEDEYYIFVELMRVAISVTLFWLGVGRRG